MSFTMPNISAEIISFHLTSHSGAAARGQERDESGVGAKSNGTAGRIIPSACLDRLSKKTGLHWT
jgi:hypothetical protein